MTTPMPGAAGPYGTEDIAGSAAPAGRSAGSLAATLSSPRTVAAWALVGFTALHQFFAFFQWILPGEGTFTERSTSGSFRDVVVMGMPVLAVVLASYIAPALPGARLVVVTAMIEYAVSLFLGSVMLLIGLGGVLDRVEDANDGFNALEYVVMGVASLGLIAVAGYVVMRASRSAGAR